MDVVVAITEFKNRLKSQGYAPSTIEGYSKGLDQFKRYMAGRNITDLRKVNHQVILDYQQKVMSEPIAMESKALKIRPVKRLFECLTQSHRLLINPTEGIVETSRKNRKIGPVLTVDEVNRLLDQPNLSLKTHIRDRAIMEVQYSTGIRLDEILELEVYHVDLKDRVLYIRKGKGKKQRVVPVGKAAVKYLKEYLEKIRPWYAKKNPKERRLFLNHSGPSMWPFLFLTLRSDCLGKVYSPLWMTYYFPLRSLIEKGWMKSLDFLKESLQKQMVSINTGWNSEKVIRLEPTLLRYLRGLLL